ncbi:dolichyl-phosphate beta-glucosyltransferase [Thioclava dalianensis]|uniref:Dolichyl-phosphate beta-glucosyltransferase n=1 Tax=Thioclava dalianensis TaxID=1185766 RepID=A0A074T818_9RHOB|nr:ABC transporter permease [Thioclava dalianensis]KEP67844.1 dolichyl-phosphate beta-glucosyltransferase [Thioclava dalianensis]SFN94319.1 ribose transport system permease protein [Thioclava dalianensis]
MTQTDTAKSTDTPRAGFDWITFLSKWGTLVSLGLLIALFSFGRPEVFMTVRNMLNILNQVSILGMIAFGLTICLVVGLYDLSIGAMATFGGYFAARFLMEIGIDNGAVVVLVLLVVLVLAALIGMVNGALISYLGISAIVETLAMSFVVTGVILGVSGGRTVYATEIPKAFAIIGQGKIAGIPNPVLILLLLGLLLWVFLEHTQTGRNMYALGGNREASRLSGISFSRYALIAMAISGACAALGGLVAGANLGAGRPQGVGEVYLLNAFVAVFIGASTLKPGKFHILGTAVGVLLIGVINNGLSVMGVPTFWQYIVQGSILILALISASLNAVRRG